MTDIMSGVIAGGYCSPERVKAARDKEEQKRQAYGEAYAKKVIAEYPSLKPLYDFYVKEGMRRWSRMMYAYDPYKSEDFTSELAYLDEKNEPDTQEFLEDIFNNKGVAPVEIPEEKKDLSWTPSYKMRHRPCVGCPDCRHWKNFECTNDNPNPEICDWISERYREKGE